MADSSLLNDFSEYLDKEARDDKAMREILLQPKPPEVDYPTIGPNRQWAEKRLAEKNLGLAMGALGGKLKSPALQDFLGGSVDSPESLSFKEWSKIIQNIMRSRKISKHPVSSMVELFGESAGARGIDRFKTSDPKKLVRSVWDELGKGPSPETTVLPKDFTGPLSGRQLKAYGQYEVPPHTIKIMGMNFPEGAPTSVENMIANTALHEVDHALQFVKNPRLAPVREIVGTRPKSHDFAMQEFARRFVPSRDASIKEYQNYIFNYLKENPKLHAKFSDVIRTPSDIDFVGNYPAMSKLYLNAQFGADPYLAELLKSYGHFPGKWGAREAEFPLVDLARERILNRQEGLVHPEIMSHPMSQEVLAQRGSKPHQVLKEITNKINKGEIMGLTGALAALAALLYPNTANEPEPEPSPSGGIDALQEALLQQKARRAREKLAPGPSPRPSPTPEPTWEPSDPRAVEWLLREKRVQDRMDQTPRPPGRYRRGEPMVPPEDPRIEERLQLRKMYRRP